MSWKVFEEDAPELASLGFERLNRKIIYLGLLNEDGAPRIHPVTPFIGGGMLFMFTKSSSPKIRDLRRDGRYALHCSVGGEGPLFEFLVSGHIEVITNAKVRAKAEKIAASTVILPSYVLFEFHVERVLVVEYDEHKKRHIRHWNRKK